MTLFHVLETRRVVKRCFLGTCEMIRWRISLVAKAEVRAGCRSICSSSVKFRSASDKVLTVKAHDSFEPVECVCLQGSPVCNVTSGSHVGFAKDRACCFHYLPSLMLLQTIVDFDTAFPVLR